MKGLLNLGSKSSYFAFAEIISRWQIHPKDTGSIDIQIGIYTEKIKQIEIELRQLSEKDPTFKIVRYQLLRYVGERRRHLKYLQMSDHKRYKRALNLIGKAL